MRHRAMAMGRCGPAPRAAFAHWIAKAWMRRVWAEYWFLNIGRFSFSAIGIPLNELRRELDEEMGGGT
jgi:hypothetical protein